MSLSSQSHEVTDHGRLIRVSSPAACRSITIFTLECNCRYDAGVCSETAPSTALLMTDVLCSPQAARMILFALRIVPTPNVMALIGTNSTLPKSSAASLREILSSRINLVPELACDPGSLKPMFPERPMPSICRSMPPNSAIFCS